MEIVLVTLAEHKRLIIYLGSIGLSGAVLIWWVRRRIDHIESRRRRRIKRMKQFEPMKTTTPFERPLHEAKESALESVENRFSIIRRVIYISVVVVWVFALIFPFLDEVPAAVASILIAASGVIIGVAARPLIENMISGIVISFARLIRIGDTVIVDGQYGYVEDITLTHTVIKIWNWRRYVLPNSKMLGKEFINCTLNDHYQWAHVDFWAAYGADLERVEELAVQAATGSKYFAGYEAPRFWVMEMESQGYKCWVAAWADSPADAWQLCHDIRTSLVQLFTKEGIKTHSYQIKTSAADSHP